MSGTAPSASDITLVVELMVAGPWDIAASRVLPVKDLYSARIVRDRAGEWQVLGFIDGSDRDEFVGELSDPIPLGGLGLL